MADRKDLQIKIAAFDEFSSTFNKLNEQITKATSNLEKLNKPTLFQGLRNNLNNIGNTLKDVGTKASVFLTAPLVGLVKKSVDNFKEQEQAIAQVRAGLASTGNVAGFTADKLAQMADQLQKKTLFGDDEILQKVTANLLTFTNIRGQIFAQAQQASLDMAARTGNDIQSTTMQIAKALNDPVKGIARLQKAGVQLDDSQQKQVQAFMARGKIQQAQLIILNALMDKFGGSAEAAANTGPGKLQNSFKLLTDSLSKLGGAFEHVFAKAIPIIDKVTSFLNGLTDEQNEFLAKTILVGAALGPVLLALGGLAAAISFLLTPIGALSLAIGALISGFIYFKLTAEQTTAAIKLNFNNVVEYISDIAKSFWQPISDSFSSVITSITDKINIIKDIFGVLITFVKDIASFIWDPIYDNFVKVIDSIKNVLAPFINFVSNIFGKVSEIVGTITGNAGSFNSNTASAPLQPAVVNNAPIQAASQDFLANTVPSISNNNQNTVNVVINNANENTDVKATSKSGNPVNIKLNKGPNKLQ